MNFKYSHIWAIIILIIILTIFGIVTTTRIEYTSFEITTANSVTKNGSYMYQNLYVQRICKLIGVHTGNWWISMRPTDVKDIDDNVMALLKVEMGRNDLGDLMCVTGTRNPWEYRFHLVHKYLGGKQLYNNLIIGFDGIRKNKKDDYFIK